MKHADKPHPLTREYLGLQVRNLRGDGWPNTQVRRIMYETYAAYRAYLWHYAPNPVAAFLGALVLEIQIQEDRVARLEAGL